MKVTLAHFRSCPGFGKKAGFCAKQGRAFAKELGLDWAKFRREGIDSAELEATGNPYAIALAKHAKEQARG